MAEAIISRRGKSSSSNKILITEIISENSNWVMPSYISNNSISVRIFGGGGGGMHGGGGWMNNGEFTFSPGTVIPIAIGDAGYRRDGGTTSFGTYLSANGGGSDSNGGAGGGKGGTGYQFGGGGTYNQKNAGSGGIWGGGGGGGGMIQDATNSCSGGNGGAYGGGGGGGGYYSEYDFSRFSIPGSGGTYGGGGGGCEGRLYYRNGGINFSGIGPYRGSGGTYGGAGGGAGIRAVAGTNTIGNLSVPVELRGQGTTPGLTDKTVYLRNGIRVAMMHTDGGGGFGGNGGYGMTDINYNNAFTECIVMCGGGGGGGYGGDGGNGRFLLSVAYRSGDYVFGGGGGGYGGKGGDAYIGHGGGGGGYFSDGYIGTDIGGINSGGGGGGYYSHCHGGGGYLPDKSRYRGFGCGGSMANNTLHDAYYTYPATPGGCIIQYWI